MHVLQCRVPKYMYLSLYQNNVYHSQQGLEKYSDRARRGGVLPYISMCRPKGYGF